MLGIPWREATDCEQYDFNVKENFHDNVGVIRNLITKYINWNRLIFTIPAKKSLEPMKNILQLKNTVYEQMIKKDEDAKKTDNLRVSVEGRSALYTLKNMHLLVNHTSSYAKKKNIKNYHKYNYKMHFYGVMQNYMYHLLHFNVNYILINNIYYRQLKNIKIYLILVLVFFMSIIQNMQLNMQWNH